MNDSIDNLRQALAQRPLPRWSRMGPELGYGRHRGPARSTTRQAAVLIALFHREDEWRLPLTVRPAGMSRHQGQISLPGGLIEPNEDSEAAALREFGEELGPASVEIVGALEECYVYVSDTVVIPWVGVIQRHRAWQPNPREVERVIEMPLKLLEDPAAQSISIVQRGPLQFKSPGYDVGTDHVWGATAVILEQFSNLLRRHIH